MYSIGCTCAFSRSHIFKEKCNPPASIKQKGEAAYSLGGIYVLQNLNKKVVPQIRTNDSK